MSKMSRMIARINRDLKGGTKWYHVIYDAYWFWWEHSAIGTFYYNMLNFVRNIWLFIGLAWNWRPWDYSYTINTLVVLLTEQAKSLENGCHIGSEKIYRRCMTAAGKLDKAYNRDVDKVIVYLMHRNPMQFRPLKNKKLYKAETVYNIDKRIYDGMYEVARKRSEKEEALAKKEAWQYLHKYIEHFWD